MVVSFSDPSSFSASRTSIFVGSVYTGRLQMQADQYGTALENDESKCSGADGEIAFATLRLRINGSCSDAPVPR